MSGEVALLALRLAAFLAGPALSSIGVGAGNDDALPLSVTTVFRGADPAPVKRLT